MSSNIDDDFDWAAAVVEIDKACSRHIAPENWEPEPSNTQSRALQQKTLDSFVRGGVRQGANVTEGPAQHGARGALDSSRQWVGHQSSTGTDVRNREVSSDAGEASSSGCRLPLDYEAAKVWIYPANVPRRSYQFNITKSALFSNTLVCLPTGLGKTLIAAVVMYNYFRWFPTGKIVFTAPSRPLVVQQIEACHKVTGMPQNMTIDMTGQMNPQIRAEHWQSKRVFFVTPQVLEKDIQAGRAATNQLVCLVVDEAHRATGNYSYCVVIRELLAAKVEPRILALTATPGSKQITIQAVVDNLQISSLEYRDEHDPDVSQYTHNRKIELIEVAMNAESTQVKDVFIEVLQPIVQKLCYLGVFYSREISRLTPYEFLTARDKFREAPPQALPQSKYQDVETYFGLAITLFHIFKLLITHGMRPAYEMLRQKLEQGVLKRLSKNEKMLQIQDLMKQSIGHGAPNPKLEKVVEIINDHFSVHDATNTRVIIFTNYRESVKDILDKLAAVCESVKAMEFIGQSSGKTSKGQTQKTQQAVLQRFRGGCYNTIVATSIAEEGLDIMEVDLVICFDANISPLRMIQRMGRTGRKRDGRVVVLASGGSEIQGYLKKQSKSKALGKHMLNGGVRSFNFHASHHMIPHSLRTTVQFVELAIEDFVPRGRRMKEKDLKAVVGPRKLTEKELEIVRLVKAIPDLNPRIKGGPEDPVNKFFVCPVYQVKHSKRSCLLMDCLQTLGVPVQLTSETRLSKDKIPSPSPMELPVEGNIPVPVNGIQAPTSPLYETLSDDSGPAADPKNIEIATPAHLLPSSLPFSLDPCRIDKTCPQDLPSPKDVLSERRHHEGAVAGVSLSSGNLNILEGTNEPIPYTDLDEQADGDYCHSENAPAPPIRNKLFPADHMPSEECKATVVVEAAHQHQSFSLSEQPGVDCRKPIHQLQGTGLCRCKYGAGVSSVTQTGLVLMASPPSLLLSRKVDAKGSPNPSAQCDFLRVDSEALDDTEAEPNNKTEQRQTYDFSPRPSPLVNHSLDHATPVCHRAWGYHNMDSVAATPDERVVDSLLKETRLQKDVIQARAFSSEELSPRLAEFANHGVVPSTPCKDRTPVSQNASVSSLRGTDLTEGHPSLPSDLQTHIPPAQSTFKSQKPWRNSISHLSFSSPPPEKDAHCQGRSPQKTMGLSRVSARPHPIDDISPLQPRNLTQPKPRPLIFDYSKTERLPLRDQSIPGVENDRNFRNIEETLQPVGNQSKTKTTSPLQIRSSGEDWRIHETQASGSVQKPRKLKRLRRVNERLPTSSVERSLKRCLTSSVQNQANGKAHHSRLERDKQQRKLAARAFIDEEAEVSSDDFSGEDECEDEEGSSLEGFIDTAATQHLNGSVDMVNIYRKSLLTQSPLGFFGAQQISLQNATPSSDATPSSIEPSLVSIGLEDELSDFGTAPSVRRPLLVRPQNTIQMTPIVDLDKDRAESEGKCRETLGAQDEGPKDENGRKVECRKRKLSFQSSSTYEDDLFEGVDLDALEAEATEISRIRSQAQVISSNALQEHVVACPSSLPSRPFKDNEFEFIPSFDLGLDT